MKEVIDIEDNRLIICIDARHASILSEEFSEKCNGKYYKYKSTVEFDETTYHFISLSQLRNGRADGARFTDVKVSKGAHGRDELDFHMIDRLRADASIWKSYLSNKTDGTE